jgi:ankyrin repeat protein
VIERFILTNDINLRSKNTDGNSALHVVAQSGSERIVKLLLDRGLDPLATNNAGQTTFHLGIIHRKEKLAKLLFDVVNDLPH